jgi:hypothetical protein
MQVDHTIRTKAEGQSGDFLDLANPNMNMKLIQTGTCYDDSGIELLTPNRKLNLALEPQCDIE